MEICFGLELFSKIASPHIGKILISNFIDHQNTSTIIDARNKGVFDMSLDKTKDFAQELPKAIMTAKNKFFTALSNLLFSDISLDHPLADNDFAKFYLGKIDEYKPKEIIPNHNFSKFTFVCDNGNPDVIIQVTNEKEIQQILASTAAKTAPRDLIPLIASGEYMLCHKDGVLPEGSLWPIFVRQAKQISGKNNRFIYNISEDKNIEKRPVAPQSTESRI